MLNLTCLRTLVAISQHSSFAAAGRVVGLSHSAVSLHVKTLEDTLNVALFDRARRPPILTDKGVALVEYATRILALVDEASTLADHETLVGTLRIGVVPSALINLLPPALAHLRKTHPKVQLLLRSGLSSELALLLRNREIDMAILTDPPMRIEGLRVHPIAQDPIRLIAPANAAEATAKALFSAHPYIWFDRRSWAGQQIEQHLQRLRLPVNPAMEVTALEAVETLVRNGLGISVVPKSALSPDYGPGIREMPLQGPILHRSLVMAELDSNPRAPLCRALLQIVVALVHADQEPG